MLRDYVMRLPAAAWDTAKLMALAYILVWVFAADRMASLSWLDIGAVLGIGTLLLALQPCGRPMFSFTFEFNAGKPKQ